MAEVWLAETDGGDPDELAFLLSHDERDRAHRFHTAELRRQYTKSHAALRSILGTRTSTPREELNLGRRPCRRCGGAHGKPFLPDHPDLSFNLAHSGDVAVVAVSEASEIGVDVEVVEKRRDIGRLAAAVLAPAELDEFERLAPRDRLTGFLTAWTRKEALLKACGHGIAGRLSEIAVSPLRRGARTLAPGGRIPGTWTVCDLPPMHGYVGAVAVEGGRPALTYRTWRSATDPPSSVPARPLLGGRTNRRKPPVKGI